MKLTQFLIEAVMLTSIGILLGFLLAYVAALVLGFSLSVPAWAMGIGLLMSATVGLNAGIYPAARAARLDPVVAIRGN